MLLMALEVSDNQKTSLVVPHWRCLPSLRLQGNRSNGEAPGAPLPWCSLQHERPASACFLGSSKEPVGTGVSLNHEEVTFRFTGAPSSLHLPRALTLLLHRRWLPPPTCSKALRCLQLWQCPLPGLSGPTSLRSFPLPDAHTQT